MSRTILGIPAFSCCRCHAPIGVCRTAHGSSAPGSSPEPSHRAGCFHRATSSLAGTCWVLPISSLECERGRTSLRWTSGITQRLTGNRPLALILNGAVGHRGLVTTSDSQATPNLPWCAAAQLQSPNQRSWHVAQEDGQRPSYTCVSIWHGLSLSAKSTPVLHRRLHQGQVSCHLKTFLLKTKMRLFMS